MKDLCQKWKVTLIFRAAYTTGCRNRDCRVFGSHRRMV